jgi:hypothetical protein
MQVEIFDTAVQAGKVRLEKFLSQLAPEDIVSITTAASFDQESAAYHWVTVVYKS